MTIYFDNNKEPYNTPVEGYIATCTDEQWSYYSRPENMDKWDIIECKFMDITNTEKYKAKQLANAKEEKLQEIKRKNTEKYSKEGETIKVELPATLQKGEETKQVTSFKLLTLTSAGQLSTVIMGYTLMANTMDIPDLLNDSEGYTIVGLNTEVNGTKFVNLIFAKLSEEMGKITQYQRYLEQLVQQATTIEEVQAIYVDFDNMPILNQDTENIEEQEDNDTTQDDEVTE